MDPMVKRFVVELDSAERKELLSIINLGKGRAYRIKHANILLKADESSDGWCDKQIASAFGCHPNTVANVRQRFVELGMEAALGRKTQDETTRKRLVDGEVEAKIIALRCSSPPEGYSRWTLHLLADRLVELEEVPSISHETVRKTLKKTNFDHT
jgi:transposase